MLKASCRQVLEVLEVSCMLYLYNSLIIVAATGDGTHAFLQIAGPPCNRRPEASYKGLALRQGHTAIFWRTVVLTPGTRPCGMSHSPFVIVADLHPMG